MAGWNNTSIEIFNPPYLYRGPRPAITSAPSSVQRAETFHLQSPDAATIDRVVLVRPMAVTHQTDTEQKVLHLPFVATGFSTFGTLDTNGAVTDRFGVGNDVDALAFAPGNRGFGPNLFYYLRHDAAGFSTFGTIDTSGAVTDRFGVGNDFDALTFVAGDLGYGSNLFYYLRHDAAGFSTFGTIDTSGAVTDRFGVGNDFDALTFASAIAATDRTCSTTCDTTPPGSPRSAPSTPVAPVTDRFGVGNDFDALTFAPGNRGYGPNLFYYLRQRRRRVLHVRHDRHRVAPSPTASASATASTP